MVAALFLTSIFYAKVQFGSGITKLYMFAAWGICLIAFILKFQTAPSFPLFLVCAGLQLVTVCVYLLYCPTWYILNGEAFTINAKDGLLVHGTIACLCLLLAALGYTGWKAIFNDNQNNINDAEN